MECFALFLTIWFFHIAAAVVLGYPVIRPMWKRAQFERWEASAFIVPYLLWAICFLLCSFREAGWGKSLANVAVEPFFISAAIIAAAVLRAIVGCRPWTRLFSQSLICALCALALCIFFFTPGLPE
jgi:hypothetical protein